MAITEVTILVIWFLFYIIFKSINPYFASAYVFTTFIFAFTVSSQSFSSFYLLIYLVAIVLDLAISQINSTSQIANSFKAGKFTTKGFGFISLSLMIGLVMFLAISLVSKQVGGNIVGVPNLAVTTPSEIGMAFKPTFEATLGIIENTIAFVIFDILLVFGLLLPLIGFFISVSGFILPLLLASLIMAILHITAYSVSISLMLYAMLAFIMFILSRMILQDSLASDFSHYLNNGVISLSRSLQIVGVS